MSLNPQISEKNEELASEIRRHNTTPNDSPSANESFQYAQNSHAEFRSTILTPTTIR